MCALQNLVTRNSFTTSFSRKALFLTTIFATNFLTKSNMSSNDTTYVAGENSIVYVTTPNDESAKKIARKLITEKLAACVNIIPNIQSIYEWEGCVNEDVEYLLMIKTKTDKVNDLSKFVRENHPYSVAEVISVKIENGNPPYLDWIKQSVQP